ncbi:MAG TPA: serine/threonine-protein kinase [Ktedonobacteraceae bacterium]|nr:serine/threonine-protein kinase [Ktedonobacteraceae bacterium]
MSDRSGQQLDRYRLMRLLGEGGFSQVYLAEDIYRGTAVAVKLLKFQSTREEFQSFLNEARIFRLKHAHIIPVLDFGVETKSSIPFIVMMYAPNGTLRQRHPRGSRLLPSTIIQYVKEVAGALQYAHEENLIHRDVKPENMLVGQQMEVLLSDFGIATVSQSGRISMTQQTQVVQGTYYYMAPEQFYGKACRASDQYSLGIVAYEWLCGTCPFQGLFYEVVGQHLHVAPPSLRERGVAISLQTEQIVMTALAKNPGNRHANVREFAQVLEQSLKDDISKMDWGEIQQKAREEAVQPVQSRKYEEPFRRPQGEILKEYTQSSKRSVTRPIPAVYKKGGQKWLEEGNVYYAALRFQEAITAYNQAINSDPRCIAAYYGLGSAYHQLGLYQRAASEFDQVLSLDPGNAWAYYSKGLAYYELGLYQRAIDEYDQAIALDHAIADFYDKRGSAYYHLEQYPRALSEFEQALRLNPRIASVYYKRGYIYLQLAYYQQAINDFDRALTIDPRDAWAYYNRGRAYEQIGQYERARGNYERAIALNPELAQKHVKGF